MLYELKKGRKVQPDGRFLISPGKLIGIENLLTSDISSECLASVYFNLPPMYTFIMLHMLHVKRKTFTSHQKTLPHYHACPLWTP